jgi:hypothetical protein
MKKSEHKSNYARKRKFLVRMSNRLGRRVFGFEFKFKPWKVKAVKKEG